MSKFKTQRQQTRMRKSHRLRRPMDRAKQAVRVARAKLSVWIRRLGKVYQTKTKIKKGVAEHKK